MNERTATEYSLTTPHGSAVLRYVTEHDAFAQMAPHAGWRASVRPPGVLFGLGAKVTHSRVFHDLTDAETWATEALAAIAEAMPLVTAAVDVLDKARVVERDQQEANA